MVLLAAEDADPPGIWVLVMQRANVFLFDFLLQDRNATGEGLHLPATAVGAGGSEEQVEAMIFLNGNLLLLRFSHGGGAEGPGPASCA